MSSFACVVLLLLVSINVLQANNNTNSENERQVNPRNATQPTLTKKSEKRKVIVEFQLQLEKRNKFNRDIKTVEEFWKKRNEIADMEVRQLLGNSLPLDENELEANKIILSKKYEEYDKSLHPKKIFPPCIHFLHAKHLIEESEIFQIIKKMPKGANIYTSFLSMIDLEFFFELTFDENLYFLFEEKLYFKFSKTKPGPKWRDLSYIRETEENPEYIHDLNNAIKESLGIISTETWPSDSENALKKFFELRRVRLSLIKYKLNFIKCFKKLLENLYEDNIMYAEISFQFPELYDLEGNTYGPVSVLRLCKTILDDFKKTHKHFIGVRFYFIYENHINDIKDLIEFRKIAKDLWRANPYLMAGIEIVIYKKPLSDWVEELLKFPKEMKLFIICGFTYNWGIDVDYSILDALVLNVEAIGGAFAVNKHPVVLEELRKADIPIRFSPILAQILNYVKDLRKHPLSILPATNFPVVIGNLGGSYVNATGLSYDWYEAYMAMTPRFCDIRCLKQFAINSWIYCTLPIEEKKKAISAWEYQWDLFIEDLANHWAVKTS